MEAYVRRPCRSGRRGVLVRPPFFFYPDGPPTEGIYDQRVELWPPQGGQLARTATPELFRSGRTFSPVPRCEGCRAGRGDVAIAEALLGTVQAIIRALDGALADCHGAIVSARLRFGDGVDDEECDVFLTVKLNDSTHKRMTAIF